jgi:hypothetical protein
MISMFCSLYLGLCHGLLDSGRVHSQPLQRRPQRVLVQRFVRAPMHITLQQKCEALHPVSWSQPPWLPLIQVQRRAPGIECGSAVPACCDHVVWSSDQICSARQPAYHPAPWHKMADCPVLTEQLLADLACGGRASW